MKSIFTVHAGEYLVGELLEAKYNCCEVWIPSKDTGTDLLVTKAGDRSSCLGIQVKFSKDFLPQMKAVFHDNLVACGWWTLNRDKIVNSNAQIWILTPFSFQEKKIHAIIVKPKLLLKKLETTHGICKTYNVYLWVTADKKCFETRSLKGAAQMQLARGDYSKINKNRNFTEFLDAFDVIERSLKL